jgi:coenzyme F420-0:L-glutamate ligase/coenzyme F420-1:gamma-L-glutamate ligase
VRDRIAALAGVDVGVIVTDSFGRPFRQGTTDVAIGVSGVPAIVDLRGTKDRIGYELRSSRVAVADEIAAAADLARGKAEGIPAVVVRGLGLDGDGSAQEIVIEHELDLFS